MSCTTKSEYECTQTYNCGICRRTRGIGYYYYEKECVEGYSSGPTDNLYQCDQWLSAYNGHSHGNYFCRYYDNDCDGCVSDYSGGDCVYCDGICLGRINNVQDIYKMECSSSCDNGLFEMSYLYGLAIVVGFILLVSFSTLIWRSKQFRKYHKEDNKSSNIERGVGFSRAPISISRNMQLFNFVHLFIGFFSDVNF
eukprot:TRINITY_DN3464_c1_g2_i4.p1 TRINITY_DN3464_c1_g2~~TRINITY_DN3464_c1_g2_i4.p1  ORF type:complete len:196 (+),score=3.09 TRINITY_DN3464_c1_g2_i4:135-722(+)